MRHDLSCLFPLLYDLLFFGFTSHLVIETSQEISDVPYGDYFRVQVQSFTESL